MHRKDVKEKKEVKNKLSCQWLLELEKVPNLMNSNYPN